ncbi:polar amino acid transport system ATP-binding protein [Arboricoccus pini]|uniref:Polar amino acid transport system ATP-binding protein n=1 Tax=Arboricoccus pini TaxID=1963835 RepID=A0A212S2S0_9PROT|nr:amino acid ABC transporter ATP-binding protein [Arboricoccus pini]SNB79426.1 polar amino acid transport system ATP-binding protein [Arboricoccus pini]
MSQPHSAQEDLITVRQLRKAYGATYVLKGVDLKVKRGEVSFIIGPSGGGKSTLLRCLNFLVKPSGGEIIFGDRRLCHEDGNTFHVVPERELRDARSRMPMVFQHFNLFNHRTVLENVIEGPTRVQKRNKEEAIAEARVILDKVGLLERQDFYPDQLSGGQKQRVAIARAMAMRPQLILFDEPTSALDPELVSGILDTIRQLAVEGMTMVVVSHEMKFARRLADRVHFVAEGIVVESGTPERVFDAPESDRLKGFISSILH